MPFANLYVDVTMSVGADNASVASQVVVTRPACDANRGGQFQG